MELKELSLATNKEKMAYLSFEQTDKNTLSAKIEQAAFDNYKDLDDGVEAEMELISALRNNATDLGSIWSREIPNGADGIAHYETFINALEEMAFEIYFKNKRFCGNKFIVSASILPILCFSEYFEPTAKRTLTNTHKVGTIAVDSFNAEVYVSPYLNKDEILCICKASDNLTGSVAVSILDNNTYSIKVLNKDLILQGNI